MSATERGIGANRAAISRPTPANWAAMLSLGFVWGAAFLGIALALRGFGPVQVAAGRLFFGSLALAALIALLPSTESGPKATRAHIPYFLLLGIFGSALPFVLLAWGQTRVSSGFAGVGMASVALFILPMAHVLVPGDRMTPAKTAGFLLGFAGVAILLGPSLLVSGWAEGEAVGRLAVFGAAFCYAVASLTTRLAPETDPRALALWQVAIGAIILVPIALVVEGIPVELKPLPTAALLTLALIPTALAAYLRITVIRSAGPSFMSMVSFQVPLWAVMLGIVVLGEPASPSLFVALAFILAGMVISRR